jgi:hypothetical protein
MVAVFSGRKQNGPHLASEMRAVRAQAELCLRRFAQSPRGRRAGRQIQLAEFLASVLAQKQENHGAQQRGAAGESQDDGISGTDPRWRSGKTGAKEKTHGQNREFGTHFFVSFSISF